MDALGTTPPPSSGPAGALPGPGGARDSVTPFEQKLLRRETAATALRTRQARRRIYGGRVLVVAAFLALWQAGSGRVLDPFFFSTPSEIAKALVLAFTREDALYHIRYTLLEVVAGYIVGVVAGLLLAVLLTIREEVYQLLEPLILAVNGIPRVALAPIIIMWFGIGITPKIIVAALLVFFVVLLNTVAGIRTIDPWLIHVSRILGGTRREILRKVVFPAIAPYVITSLRMTVPMAVIGAIVGEFISSNRGLGFLVNKASNAFDTPMAFAAIILLLVFVVVLNSLIGFVERRSLRWLSERRGGDAGVTRLY
jgi:NitT/TauT family transport system permease protein